MLAGPLTYIAMDYYAALTVSTDPAGTVPTMAQGAAVITSGLLFTDLRLSNFMDIELEK